MSKSIVKACVRYNDRLYTGFDHGECFKRLNEDNTILVHSDIEQGFVDSDGNFVDRKQAMIIAKESGQLRYEPNKETLISEDLHLDWLNKQAQRIAELEEQLQECIRPKFKIGDKVYAIIDTWAYTDVFPVEIRDTHLLYEVWDGEDTTKQHFTRIFATKEEAEAKLKELQGERE